MSKKNQTAENDAEKRASRRRALLGWAVFGASAGAVLALGLMFASVMERRGESYLKASVIHPLSPLESDSSAWRINFPRQHDSFRRTIETEERTLHGGPAMRDYLAETPANVILFAGSAFAKDYNQARGHAWSRQDTLNTGRLAPDNPATCWTCKSSDVPRIMAEMGAHACDDDSEECFHKRVLAGAGQFYATDFHDLAPQISHPIGCLDCHDPATGKLRLTRPALIEALAKQGRKPADIPHQEMRSLVCAQCHVEYYFRAGDNYLILPWDHGTGVEAMERYYDERKFTDYTHAISGTPIIKMQHPDYELYSKGIHAYRNVSCADCHMPYRTEGGVKFSNHHVQSPLLNIDNSCAVCHRWGEQEIRSRVESIQNSVKQGRERAERALAQAHFDVAACKQAGAGDEQLAPMRALLRAAQVRWDYVAAAKGMGFHAPQECLRILGGAVDLAQQARVDAARLLASKGYHGRVVYPDYGTKEQAQALVKKFIAGEPPNLLPPRENDE